MAAQKSQTYFNCIIRFYAGLLILNQCWAFLSMVQVERVPAEEPSDVSGTLRRMKELHSSSKIHALDHVVKNHKGSICSAPTIFFASWAFLPSVTSTTRRGSVIDQQVRRWHPQTYTKSCYLQPVETFHFLRLVVNCPNQCRYRYAYLMPQSNLWQHSWIGLVVLNSELFVKPELWSLFVFSWKGLYVVQGKFQ